MPLPTTLPVPSDRRLAVRVTADARRHLAAGHPWVFADSITSLGGTGAAGDLAVIFDDDRRFTAIGLYDPASPIRIKVLHHGRPTPIDASFWRTRLDAAMAIRAPLVASADTTGYRCVNGENDRLPGLVIDRYDDWLVLKLYTAAWIPHLPTVVEAIVDRLAPVGVVVRLSRAVRGGVTGGLRDGMAVHGDPPDEPVHYLEHGLVFEADLVRGQKTGAFLDQRDNRALVGSLATGARVLDVFASTGGFGLHAAAGGAARVLSVDQSDSALAAAQRNWERNRHVQQVAACSHETLAGDAFEVMDRLIRDRRRFDIVVIDPPSFAHRRTQVEQALRAYGELAAQGVQLCRDDGLLVQASCSSRIGVEEFIAAVRRGAGRQGAELEEHRRTTHPIDHPVTFPQGAYLKALFARVRRT